jgi:hypothetical protein
VRGIDRELIQINHESRATLPAEGNSLYKLGRSSGLGIILGPAFPLAQWLMWVFVIPHSCGAAPDSNRLPEHRVDERVW